MARAHWALFGFGVLFALAIALVAIIGFHSGELLGNGQQWEASGGFSKGDACAFTPFDRQMSARERQLDFWDSWTGDEAHTAALKSPVFRAPGMIQCFLSGYPGRPGLELYLERERDHLRFPLAVPGNSYPGGFWRKYYWSLPSSIRGEDVRLVASDQATGSEKDWLGVSTPLRFSYLGLLHQQLPSSLYALGHLLLNYSLFLLPGFGLTSLLWVKLKGGLRYPLITIIITSAACGYSCFYAFLASRPAGKLLVGVIYLGALAGVGIALRNASRVGELCKAIAEPLALSGVTALCYFCLAFLFINPAAGAENLYGRFFSRQMPGDNLIPLIFANKVYDRTPLYPFCCGEWHSSDRPPLQTGIFLMERPLPLTSNLGLSYQCLASALQSLWICGAWCFLRSVGTKKIYIRRALLLLIFTGLIFYESVYTWPKFLTATLVLFAVSVVIDVVRSKRCATFEDCVVSSVCLGLALVSHPGSMFSLLAILLFVCRFRALFSFRSAALALAIASAFVLPWTAYQKFVDPPGDRLIKVHFAGLWGSDSVSAWQTIRAAYQAHTWSEIASLRWSNIKGLAGYKPFDSLGYHDLAPNDPMSLVEWNRVMQEKYIWNALSGLNVGWLGGIVCLVLRRATRRIMFAKWMLLAVAINAFVWCLLEFGPEYSIIAHYSFADLLVLAIALIALILELPRAFTFLVLAIQLFNFFAVWVWSPPYAFSAWAGDAYAVSFQLPMLIFGLTLALLIIVYLGRSLFSGSESADLAPA